MRIRSQQRRAKEREGRRASPFGFVESKFLPTMSAAYLIAVAAVASRRHHSSRCLRVVLVHAWPSSSDKDSGGLEEGVTIDTVVRLSTPRSRRHSLILLLP